MCPGALLTLYNYNQFFWLAEGIIKTLLSWNIACIGFGWWAMAVVVTLLQQSQLIISFTNLVRNCFGTLRNNTNLTNRDTNGKMYFIFLFMYKLFKLLMETTVHQILFNLITVGTITFTFKNFCFCVKST
jgi:hypothetical protein